MSDFRTRLQSWIFDSFDVSPKGLALYRITVAVFALLFAAPGFNPYFRFDALGALPDVFFLPPPGPMQLAWGFPPEPVFSVLHILLVLSLTALLLGYRTRTASIATTGLMLFGYGFLYSLGKINHNILFVLLPLVMGFSNWGAAWSLDARAGRAPDRVTPWPVMMTMLITGFAMLTAGFPKILGGWLDPHTQGAQSRLVHGFFVNGRQDFLAEAALAVEHDLFWELFDIATVAFEIGFFFALLHPATIRLFAAGAVFFHTGVMLVMNIAFPTNFIVYAAVLSWPSIADAIDPRVAPLCDRVPTWAWAGMGGAVAVFFTSVGSPLLWLDFGLTSDLLPADVLVVATGIAVVLAALVSALHRRFSYVLSSANS